jgi:hypothetical protein
VAKDTFFPAEEVWFKLPGISAPNDGIVQKLKTQRTTIFDRILRLPSRDNSSRV